jgi:hypothetical protein
MGAAPLTDSLTNGNTIQGSGSLQQMGLTNAAAGIINANVNGQTLQLTSLTGTWVNAGLMEASGGGKLALVGGATLTNTGGTIQANAGSTVDLNSMTVNGGTFKTVGNGTLQLDVTTVNSFTAFTNSATGTVLSGLGPNTIAGLLDNSAGGNVFVNGGIGGSLAVNQLNNGGLTKVFDNQILTLNGGVTDTNSGTISLNSLGSATKLVINNGTVTLNGGGTVTLAVLAGNPSINSISGSGASPVLNNIDNTISGVGTISGLGSANGGTIRANVSGGTLTVKPNASWTNTGTLTALGGGTLTLDGTGGGGTLTDAGGTVSANGGTVKALSMTINGGTLSVANASELQLGATIISGANVTNNSGGTIRILPVQSFIGGASSTFTNNLGASVIVQAGNLLEFDSGGTFTNNGSITLNNGGTTLRINGGPVTLAGSGTVQMGTDGTTAIVGAFGSETLTNNNTIQGSGGISALHLANTGTINANVNGQTLAIGPNGAWTNTNMLEATLGGTLTLAGALTNTGGTISAIGSGSVVQLNNNTSITGGTLTTSGGGLIKDPGTVTLTNLANSGMYQVTSGSTTILVGTINNTGGTFNVLSGGVLNIDSGGVSLTGGGAVTLAGTMSAQSGINPALTTDNIFTGTGNIGNGNLTLVSSGIFQSDTGGTLTIQTPGGFTNTGTMNVKNNSTLLVNASGVTDNGGTTTIDAGSILDNTGFTYTQTGSNTTTNVNGTLKASLVDIKGGTLEGSGTITGSLTEEGGQLNPGNSPGTFNVSGNYTQTAGGTLDIELGTSSFDILAITGTGTFAGALDIFSFGGFTPSDGETFQIINYGSLGSDGFATPTSFIPNFTFTQDFSSTFITLTAHSTVTVPEPSTMFLLAAGLAALLVGWKRRSIDRA